MAGSHSHGPARPGRPPGRKERDRALKHYRTLQRDLQLVPACTGEGWFAYRRRELVADAGGRRALAELLPDAKAEPLGRLDALDLELLELPPDGPDPLALADAARRLTPDGGLAPNYVPRLQAHVLYFPDNVPTVIRTTPAAPPAPPSAKKRGATPVVVGVVDTGVRRDHPWWVDGGGIVTGDEEHAPASVEEVELGHGTFIAGVLRHHAPAARVVVAGLGAQRAITDWGVATAMLDLGRRVDVLNLSFGVTAPQAVPPLAMRRAVDALERERGDDLAIVAAAGNDATSVPTFPAAARNVIAVGAVEADGHPADYTNRGAWVDACAVGSWDGAYFEADITGLGRFRGYCHWEGTSFAAPVVAGRIAAAYGASDGSVPPRRVAQRLLNDPGATHVAQLGTFVP